MSVLENPFFVCAYILVFICVNNMLINAIENQAQNLEPFHFCIKQSKEPRLGECIGRTALNFLQRFDEKDNYTLADNLVSTKDEKISARSLLNVLDTDPVDFRGILENAGAVVSQRSFEWHMDNVYPGLMLRIGPSADENSLAEFIIDPAVAERQFNYQEPSTARILAKQYLLPFLLGLKFKLVALVPLLFAGIALLLKKSLFLAKLAIYVSSFLGFGGVASILGGLGLGGIGAGLAGGGIALGAGPGGLLGGFGIGPHHVRGHGGVQPAFDVASALGGGQTSYFPGKTTVYNQHVDVAGNLADEHYHGTAPYKRSERKVNFDKPRDYVGPRTLTTATSGSATATTTTTSTSFNDRFYDYDKQKFTIQDRSGKLRSSNAANGSGKLGPSAYDDEEDEVKKIFKPSEQLGWKVVDMRV